MRVLLLGAAAIALSGCSWLGIGGKSTSHKDSYKAGHGQYQQAGTSSCVSGQCLSRWNVEGGIGVASFVGGDAITGSDLNPGQDVTVNDFSMRDAYDTGIRAELGTSYALSPNSKVIAMANYQKNKSSGPLNLGTIGGEALTGELTDYKSYGVELGLRQYANPVKVPLVKSARPYIEGRLGASRVDNINIVGLSQGGTLVGNGTTGFYEGGWIPTASGLIGVETPIAKHMTIGLESGLRYHGTLKSDTVSLPPGGPISGSNNGSDNWSVPVMLRGRYRF